MRDQTADGRFCVYFESCQILRFLKAAVLTGELPLASGGFSFQPSLCFCPLRLCSGSWGLG